MTFQVIRRTNEYTRRGDEINVVKNVVAQFDTLGFAFANACQRRHHRVLTDCFCEEFEVRDTAGTRFEFHDVWREMLTPERFDEIWNTSVDIEIWETPVDVRFKACSHVYVENLH